MWKTNCANQCSVHLRTKTLLDIVSRRPDCAFTQLLNALKDTTQHEAADIISGNSRTATESEVSELRGETHAKDAWNQVDHELKSLLHIIVEAKSHYTDEYSRTTFSGIWVASRSVVMSLRSLRERYFVPTSSIDEELEQLLKKSEVISTQGQLTFVLPHPTGKQLYLFQHNCTPCPH